MNEGYLQRLKLAEQQISVIQGDMQAMAKQFNGALNQFATSIQGIMQVHKMFNLYVDANLGEIRDKVGLTGKLLTDGTGEQNPPGEEGGVEL